MAPCYPLHPATSSSLLLLSDRIAQVNRTAFYYLQSREDGGVAGALEGRTLPAADEAGGIELLRISDLLPFFSEPLRQKEPHLVAQYEQAVAKLPGASPLELAVLRAVLVLAGIKNPLLAPTTAFLSFCLCDAEREELGAADLHEALGRLREAHALWKNEATEVWNFVTDRGLGQDLEKEIDQEKALVPSDKSAAELLRTYEVLREEITDRLGEVDLDPNDAGIVRRVAVRLLDPAKGDKAIDAQNPALAGGDAPAWLSAVIYLAAVDSAAELDACRKLAEAQIKGTAYVILPSAPLSLSADKARELLAVRQLLEKKPPHSHAFEVLENKLTSLREELRGNSPGRSATRGYVPEPEWFGSGSPRIRFRSVRGGSCFPPSDATSIRPTTSSPAYGAEPSTSGSPAQGRSGTKSRTSSRPSWSSTKSRCSRASSSASTTPARRRR